MIIIVPQQDDQWGTPTQGTLPNGRDSDAIVVRLVHFPVSCISNGASSLQDPSTMCPSPLALLSQDGFEKELLVHQKPAATISDPQPQPQEEAIGKGTDNETNVVDNPTPTQPTYSTTRLENTQQHHCMRPEQPESQCNQSGTEMLEQQLQ